MFERALTSPLKRVISYRVVHKRFLGHLLPVRFYTKARLEQFGQSPHTSREVGLHDTRDLR
jgi:hypothetical protein